MWDMTQCWKLLLYISGKCTFTDKRWKNTQPKKLKKHSLRLIKKIVARCWNKNKSESQVQTWKLDDGRHNWDKSMMMMFFVFLAKHFARPQHWMSLTDFFDNCNSQFNLTLKSRLHWKSDCRVSQSYFYPFPIDRKKFLSYFRVLKVQKSMQLTTLFGRGGRSSRVV